jgi:HEAT repeat protein
VYEAATGKLVGAPIDLGQQHFWRAVAFSPDGKRVAALFPTAKPPKDGSEGAETDPKEPLVFVLRVWDADTGKRVGPDLTAPRDKDADPDLYFSAGGRLVIASTWSGWSNEQAKQTIWDLNTGQLLALPEPARALYGRPEDPFVVTAAGGDSRRRNLVHLRDARTLAVVGKPFAVSEVRGAAADAAGTRVVLANSYWLGMWDAKTGERLHPALVVYGGAKCVAVSADGRQFAAGFSDRDGTALARVWDAATGDAISPPTKTGEVCQDVRFLAGGRVLLTVTESTVRLWDARTGEPLTALLTAAGLFGWRRTDAVVSGDALLVRRTFETSQYDRWSLVPDVRAATELREVAEAVAGRRRDAAGNLQPIPADELFALRQRIFGRFPERFGGPVPSADAILTRRPDPRVNQLAERLANAKLAAGQRAWVANLLGHLHEPDGQGPLVAALRDPDARVRQAAANALGSLEPRAPETVQALVRTLKDDKDDQTRANAARALHGSAAKAAKAELVRALKEDKAAGVREGAAYSLRAVSADPALVAALRAAFGDAQSWQVRVEAAMTVAVLVPDDKESVGVLTAALEADAWWAAQYLDELGPRAAPAAAALAKRVEKGRHDRISIGDTWHAVHALSRIGPAAKPAVPALLAKLGQDESNPHLYMSKTNYVPVRPNLIAYTLARVGPDVVPDLLKVFKTDKDAHRRRAAVLALGFLGPPAKAAVPDLEAEAKRLAAKEEKTTDEEWLATALERALGRIRDPKAIPVEQLE